MRVARPSRTLLGFAAVLAIAAPAQAANETSPGALKKQVTTTEQSAPAPAAAPAPQSAPDIAPTTDTKTTGGNKAPVNKGTVKKLVQTRTTSTTTSSGSRTAASTHTVRRAATKQRTSSSTSKRTSTRSRAGSRAAGGAGSPARTRGLTTSAVHGAPATAATGPGRARHPARTHEAVRTAAKAKKADDNPAPLTSLSRAADRVIEVIPGSVVLALAGLIALVLLLILRSLAVERQRGKALATSYGVTVEALATAIEAKDHTTGGHIERVRRLGLLLAGEMAPREARDPQMAYGFLLHDIGKLAVPDAILRFPGRLTDEQWALMRRHPDEGVRMLSNVPFLDRALDVVRHHHERWDGGGYPDGLRGDEIPLWARIFSVVDALDAITADRPYRAARSYESALEEIRHHSGTQFDPAVVAALERLDPAVVEPLLEPTQLVATGSEPLAELPDVGPLLPV